MADDSLSTPKEVMTPYKIVIVAFIEKYNRIGLKYGDELTKGINDKEYSVAERKAVSAFLFRVVQGTEMTFKDLNALVDKSKMSSRLINSWRQHLHTIMTQGIEGILDLFDSLKKAVLVDRHESWPCIWTSLVGLFMRKANLLFKKLSFNEVGCIQALYCRYCKDFPPFEKVSESVDMTTDSFTGANPVADMSSALDFTMTSPPGSPSFLATPNTSSSNIQLAVEPDEDELNESIYSEAVDDEDYENLPETWSVKSAEAFIDKQMHILQVNDSAALSPKKMQEVLQSILASFPHLSAAHFLTSLNYLRVRECRLSLESLIYSYDTQQVSGSTPRSLRYAALNMASLYSQLGNKEAALRCVYEAVSQSQDAKDEVCMQHAITWLGVLTDEHQSQEGTQLPDFSSVNHPISRLSSQLTQLLKCENIGNEGGNPFRNTKLTVWSVAASLWQEWVGACSIVSCVYSQLVLNCSPSLYHRITVPFCNEDTALCICNVAITLAGQGEYKACYALLDHGNSKFQSGSTAAKFFQLAMVHVNTNQFIMQAKFTDAENVIKCLNYDHPIYVLMRTCEIEYTSGQAEAALHAVTKLQSMKEVEENKKLQVEVNLLLVNALFIGGNSHSLAFTTLCEAITIAKNNKMHLLYAMCILHMIALQIEMKLLTPERSNANQYADAEKRNIHPYKYYNFSSKLNTEALDKAVTILMGSASLYDKARGMFVVAKVKALSSSKDKQKLVRVAKELDEVTSMFKKVGAMYRARDSLYLQCRILHDAGEIELRNKMSYEFRQVDEMLNKRKMTLPRHMF